jgi:Sap, sulfolipid-1-addressing protein
MLATRRPQRLLAVYVAAGLVFSLAVGTLVVVLLGGLHMTRASRAVRPALDLTLGVCALGYAAGAWTGWLPRPRGEAPGQDGWMRRRLADLSHSGAAVVGVLTHLPGLVYLAALNAIVHTATSDVGRVLQVVVYNAIWFSLAIVALFLSVHRPDRSRELLERILTWTGRHQRPLVVGFLGALGGYLVLAGGLGLARVVS